MSGRLPPWFRRRMPAPGVVADMRSLMDGLNLHTVCQSALCPNQGDCFAQGTATFLLLGDTCTRDCTFCAVTRGTPAVVDAEEPENLARAVAELGVRHVVITSVTRDDLPDGGASHFARTLRRLRAMDPELTVEVLVPDFQGDPEAILTVVAAGPAVLNHNLETVPRLYSEVRPQAGYRRSLRLLGLVKEHGPDILTKSGLMVGLGETAEEVRQVMADLRGVDCDLLTVGQYLRPSAAHHAVVSYVPPDEFAEYERIGRGMGFRGVTAAPLVRSSFDAARLFAGATGVSG